MVAGPARKHGCVQGLDGGRASAQAWPGFERPRGVPSVRRPSLGLSTLDVTSEVGRELAAVRVARTEPQQGCLKTGKGLCPVSCEAGRRPDWCGVHEGAVAVDGLCLRLVFPWAGAGCQPAHVNESSHAIDSFSLSPPPRRPSVWSWTLAIGSDALVNEEELDSWRLDEQPVMKHAQRVLGVHVRAEALCIPYCHAHSVIWAMGIWKTRLICIATHAKEIWIPIRRVSNRARPKAHVPEDIQQPGSHALHSLVLSELPRAA
eukprot:356002-Chlamydomonas_euryale.AAC.3